MKAVLHHRFGPPADVLELVDQDPEVPGEHDVLIRVEATPIHVGDLKNIAGQKTMIRHPGSGDDLTVALPQIPGVEGVGRIVQTGAAVADFRVGDRCLLPLQCGSWREYVRADSRRLFPAPEGDALQLSLMVNALTADLALRDLAALKAGDWFVQNAANSNVGRNVIRLAGLRDIRTVNIVRREDVVDELFELGADVVLLDGADLPRRVRLATGAAPLTIGLDSIAGPATARLAACLDDGAVVANMGAMSDQPCELPVWILHYKRICLRGYYAGWNMERRDHSAKLKLVAELSSSISTGVLRARIAGTYPLSEFREAVLHAGRAGPSRDGKIVFDLRTQAGE